MFAVSGIATLLFLGGWHTGLLPVEPSDWLETQMGTAGFILGSVLNVTVFIAKGYLLVFIMMWVRWTLPRLRIDQVMMTCLKYLLPISCVLLVGVSMWQVLPHGVLNYLDLIKYVGAIACVAFVFHTIYRIYTTRSQLPPSGAASIWNSMSPSSTGLARKS
jgi:NADH-quinone oxidoreductase subunit H